MYIDFNALKFTCFAESFWSFLYGSQKVKTYFAGLARSARVRGTEHFNGFKNDRMDNALYKHKHNDHENEEMKFSMKITQRFRDPLSRQANEAVRISSRKKDELLNSKN